MRSRSLAIALAALLCSSCPPIMAAQEHPASRRAPLMQPDELAKLIKASKGPKPLILQVGFRVLYEQAHIPGSEYVGAASERQGLEELRRRLKGVARGKAIILYCGCCPWVHCPNVQPAYRALREMGFTDVKLLYIAENFGADWVDRGYPVEKGAGKRSPGQEPGGRH